jgi:hypothetical protein
MELVLKMYLGNTVIQHLIKVKCSKLINNLGIINLDQEVINKKFNKNKNRLKMNFIKEAFLSLHLKIFKIPIVLIKQWFKNTFIILIPDPQQQK